MPTFIDAPEIRRQAVLNHNSGLRRGLLGEWFTPTQFDVVAGAWLFLPAEHRPVMSREERACFERNIIGDGPYEVLETLDQSMKQHHPKGRGWKTMAVGLRKIPGMAPIASIHVESRIQHLFTEHLFTRASMRMSDTCLPEQVPMLKSLLPHLYACANVWWAWETICDLTRLLVPEKVVARWLSERGTSYVKDWRGERLLPRYGELSDAWVRWLGTKRDIAQVQEACGILKAVYPLYEIGGEKAVEEVKKWPVRIGGMVGDHRDTRLAATRLADEYGLLAR
jgi:hypothetical protein